METINDFYFSLLDDANFDAEINNISPEDALTLSFLDFVKEANETNCPEILNVESDKQTPRQLGTYKINAFDYSDMSGTLDLFVSHFRMGQNIELLSNSKVDELIGGVNRFIFEATSGSISKHYREIRPEVAEVSDLIFEEFKEKRIKTFRVFVLSDCRGKDEFEYDDVPLTDQNIDTEYHIWDLRRLFQAEQASRHMSEIVITPETPIECIRVNDGNDGIKTYLGIIPAITLAQAYAEHKDRLIEQNVRNYLGGRIKTNAKIAETLRSCPELFFAFNNGISSVASEVETENVGDNDNCRIFIKSMRNLKIVNGGQTTCTIYNAWKNRKKYPVDLTKAFLAMKVSEIKERERSLDIVPRIAQSANLQTAIKDSDLNANSKYLISIDEISKTEWTPSPSARPNTIWYFERLRGQLLSEKLNQGDARSAKVKKFMKERPKDQVLSKTDIAKVMMSWDGFPYEASKGNEVCFNTFWKKEYKKEEVTKEYFHKIVALRILYMKIHSIFLEEGHKGYANIVDNYVLAIIGSKTSKKLDLEAIWAMQNIQPELIDPIKESIGIIVSFIGRIGNDGVNPSVVAKKLDFWTQIQILLTSVKFPTGSSIVKLTHDDLTAEQREEINKATAISPNTWKNLSNWGKLTKKMSIMERKRIDHFNLSLEKDPKSVSYESAAGCLQILRMAEEAGFKV